METPGYLGILARYRWFLAIGVVVAVVVGLLAGLTVKDGELVSRVERIYPASTTLLLSSATTPLFQSEIPSREIPINSEVVVTDPVPLALNDAAVIYAYLVAGEEIKGLVEDQIGRLLEEESITAVSRTTQPAGDEKFPGRLALPVLDVIAFAPSPDRAELISRTASVEFKKYVLREQERRQLPLDVRVILSTLKENPAGDPEGSNPAIPVVVAAGGTLVAFLALTFIIYGIRLRARTRHESGVSDEPVD